MCSCIAFGRDVHIAHNVTETRMKSVCDNDSMREKSLSVTVLPIMLNQSACEMVRLIARHSSSRLDEPIQQSVREPF